MSELANSPPAENHRPISERSDIAVTHIAARRNARPALNEAALASFGADLPSTPRTIVAGDKLIVWAGPDQWLVIEPQQAGTDTSDKHASIFKGLASVVDVSDSRAIFRVSGAKPTESLMRSMGIDFENTAFRPGDVAITHVAHLGVMVWRLPDGSGYEFACARTYSRDFLHWLGKI